MVRRKLGLDGGAALDACSPTFAPRLSTSDLIALADEVEVLVATARDAGAGRPAGGSYPFLTMTAVLIAGWLMERLGRAIDAGESETVSSGRRAAIEYFLSVIVPEALGLGAGAESTGGACSTRSGGGARLGALALEQIGRVDAKARHALADCGPFLFDEALALAVAKRVRARRARRTCRHRA